MYSCDIRRFYNGNFWKIWNRKYKKGNFIWRSKGNYTQKIFAGKWKITIIWFLKNEARRYSEIKKVLSNISQGSLTKQLRELGEDGIVGRKVYPEVPPRVEYFLTEKGKKLILVLDTMEEFGNFYVEEYIKNKSI